MSREIEKAVPSVEPAADLETTTPAASIDRRSFLAHGAKGAAGAVAASVLLEGRAARALADRERMRSLNVSRKPSVTLNFAVIGAATAMGSWQQLSTIFHAQHPDIWVNVVPYPAASWGDYFEKVLADIAGGTVPDIIRLATEGGRLFAAKGLAYPLDAFIKGDGAIEDFYSDVNPRLIKMFNIGGHQIALPFEWNDHVIYYNTTLFKKFGIAPPAPTWTGDDFLAIAEKLKAGGVWAYIEGTGAAVIPMVWMYAAGGTLLNSDSTKSTALDPNNVVGLQYLQDLIFKYKVSPRPGLPIEPLFEAGRVAMIEGGRNEVYSFKQANFTTYDVQKFPAIGPHPRYIYGSGAQSIYRHSKYPEEAWIFLKFLSSRTAQNWIAQQGFSIPSRRSSAYNVSWMNPPANFHLFYDLLPQGVDLPAPKQDTQFEDAFLALYTKMIADEMTPAQMMQQMNTQLSTILSAPA